jgi:hypothetical protein
MLAEIEVQTAADELIPVEQVTEVWGPAAATAAVTVSRPQAPTGAEAPAGRLNALVLTGYGITARQVTSASVDGVEPPD